MDDNNKDQADSEISLSRPPQTGEAVISDDRNILSEGSDDRNEYDVPVAIQGLDRPLFLLASVNMQFPCEFIFQDTLAKIEDVKTIAIPESRRKTYESPLFPGGEATPKKYIPLRVWLYQINVQIKVDLKVLEVSDPNGFEILLGSKINRVYRKNHGISLISLLDRAKTEQQKRESNELDQRRDTAPTPSSSDAKAERTESTSNTGSEIGGLATQQPTKESITQVPENALSLKADTMYTMFSLGRQQSLFPSIYRDGGYEQ